MLRTLNGTGRSKLHDQVTKPLEEADVAQRALLIQGLSGDLLAPARRPGPSMSDNPRFGQAVTVVVPFVGWRSESPVVSTDEHVTQGLAAL